MSGFDWARLPLIALMSVLLLSGGVGLIRDNENSSAAAVLAAGLVLTGAWLAMEVIAWHHRLHQYDQEEDQ